MPLYEYQCEACGRRFERIQKFSDPPVETCPTCGGKVHKLVSSPAFQFKGTGWYVTDYSRKDKGDKHQSEKAQGEKDKSKSEGETTTGASSSDKTSTDSPDKGKDTKASSAPTTTSDSTASKPSTKPGS